MDDRITTMAKQKSSGTFPDKIRPIVIVTDAGEKLINGVVTDMVNLRNSLKSKGYNVVVITPEEFRKIPSIDQNVELAIGLGNQRKMKQILNDLRPQSIFIATEGPLGLFAKWVCQDNKWNYTTHFATKFPESIAARLESVTEKLNKYLRVPEDIVENFIYSRLKSFHWGSSAIIVKTESVANALTEMGFENVKLWKTSSVDSTLFNAATRDENFIPQHIDPSKQPKITPRPFLEYMGRVAKEKRIEDFLDKTDLPGTKIVVGPGTTTQYLNELIERYPDVIFTGPKRGQELAKHVAAADVGVFTSKIDALGISMQEFIAAGVPVAAYPVTGPQDIFDLPGGDKVIALNHDISEAIRNAFNLKRADCLAFAKTNFSLDKSTEEWLRLQVGV